MEWEWDWATAVDMAATVQDMVVAAMVVMEVMEAMAMAAAMAPTSHLTQPKLP